MTVLSLYLSICWLHPTTKRILLLLLLLLLVHHINLHLLLMLLLLLLKLSVLNALLLSTYWDGLGALRTHLAGISRLLAKRPSKVNLVLNLLPLKVLNRVFVHILGLVGSWRWQFVSLFKRLRLDWLRVLCLINIRFTVFIYIDWI